MTQVYFIRHAEPDYTNHDDLLRPLTEKGLKDRELVSRFLQDKDISVVLSSPYKRSVDTVKHFADLHGLQIKTIDDFRERAVSEDWISGFNDFATQQWADRSFKLKGGECIQEVQQRNIKALLEVLKEYRDKNIIVGSHGTALSTIVNYYKSSFVIEDFLRIKKLMPWIVKFVFDDDKFISVQEYNVFDLYR